MNAATTEMLEDARVYFYGLTWSDTGEHLDEITIAALVETCDDLCDDDDYDNFWGNIVPQVEDDFVKEMGNPDAELETWVPTI